MTKEQLFDAALTLDRKSREDLAESLLMTVDNVEDSGEISQAWIEEVEARASAFDRGEIALIPGADVMAALRAKYVK